MPTDEESFSRFLRGDEGGFEDLLDRYRTPLFSFILRMVGNGEADDVFQETFMRVLRHRHRFDAARRFRPWLYAIAANLCRDALRRRKRSPELSGDELPDGVSVSNPEADSVGAEIRDAVAVAVAALPPDQREVFLLREQAGLSFREISSATGTNLNTVLGRMHQAVKKLKVHLTPLREDEI